MKFAAEWRALATQNVYIEATMFPGGDKQHPLWKRGGRCRTTSRGNLPSRPSKRKGDPGIRLTQSN